MKNLTKTMGLPNVIRGCINGFIKNLKNSVRQVNDTSLIHAIVDTHPNKILKDGYLYSILDTKQLKLIKKAIKDKPYANVHIFTRNVPVPRLQ